MELLMELLIGTVGEPSSSKIPLKKRVRISYAESEETDSGYKEQPKRASNYTVIINSHFRMKSVLLRSGNLARDKYYFYDMLVILPRAFYRTK